MPNIYHHTKGRRSGAFNKDRSKNPTRDHGQFTDHSLLDWNLRAIEESHGKKYSKNFGAVLDNSK